ncbi:ABC transporter [Sphingobium sp. LB126]|nr:ABC transporter [Sphingobium sp. LB126]
MPRAAIDDSKRMNLRVSPEAKAKLMRAAALKNIDLTSFVTQTAVREAEAIIQESEVVEVSRRDHALIMQMLENPPRANTRLQRAIAALPDSL